MIRTQKSLFLQVSGIHTKQPGTCLAMIGGGWEFYFDDGTIARRVYRSKHVMLSDASHDENRLRHIPDAGSDCTGYTLLLFRDSRVFGFVVSIRNTESTLIISRAILFDCHAFSNCFQ